MILPRAVLSLALVLWTGCATAPDPEQQPSSKDVEFVFAGNASYPGFRLERAVEDLLIDFRRDPSRESAVLDAAQDLSDFYRSEGFPDAAVSYDIEREPRTRVTFRIEEGPRVTVSGLEITGNERITTDDLLALWTREKSGLLALGDPYFVESDLRAFAVSIRERYLVAGHLDAKVRGPDITREPGTATARVKLVVAEGPVYVLASVTISDALRKDAGDVVIDRDAGKPYDGLALRRLRLDVHRALENSGHPEPDVRLATEIDREKHEVRVRIEGQAGERMRIGDVVITGNARTRSSLIRRKLVFRTGEWFSGARIEKSVEALYLTGLFSRVRVKRERRAGGTLAIEVQLEEIEAREISVLAGYGSYELLRGALYYTDRNLFGRGQRLRAGGRASLKSLGADATWTEPDVLRTQLALGVTTFYKQREEPSFTDTSHGVSTALTRRLFANSQARLGYSFERRDGSDIDPSLTTGVDNDFSIGKVFFELSHDSRDTPLYPRTGHRELVRFEHASEVLGGTIALNRMTAGASGHLSFAEDWTISVAAETGIVWNLDDEPLPVQERFYNGGESSVRSFKQSRLGPVTVSGKPAGGEYRNVLNAEFRFPIFRAFKGALFADAGNVGTSAGDWGLSNLRYAVGGGLRLLLPIGPVRLDAGWNPDTERDEDDYAIHLSVGVPF